MAFSEPTVPTNPPEWDMAERLEQLEAENKRLRAIMLTDMQTHYIKLSGAVESDGKIMRNLRKQAEVRDDD